MASEQKTFGNTTAGFTGGGEFFIRGSHVMNGNGVVQTDRGTAMDIARYIMSFGVKSGAEMKPEDAEQVFEMVKELEKHLNTVKKHLVDSEHIIDCQNNKINQIEAKIHMIEDGNYTELHKQIEKLEAELVELRAFRDAQTVVEDHGLSLDELAEISGNQF